MPGTIVNIVFAVVNNLSPSTGKFYWTWTAHSGVFIRPDQVAFWETPCSLYSSLNVDSHTKLSEDRKHYLLISTHCWQVVCIHYDVLTSRLQALIWSDDATAWNETYNPSLKVIGSQLRQSNLERTAWSDKAFKLYRALNRHNCVSRSIENPYLVIDEKPNRPWITVSIIFSWKGVFGLFFSSNVAQ